MESKKLRNRISEKSPLVSLSRRHPFFLLEKSVIRKVEEDVRVFSQEGEGNFCLPVAAIGCLILGPGCSITSEAIRVINLRGCLLFHGGGSGFPIYSHSTQHRSPSNRVIQFKKSLDDGERLQLGKLLFEARARFIDYHSRCGVLRFPPVAVISNERDLLATEGAWAREAYKLLARKLKVKWTSKNHENQSKETSLTFLNHLCYSLADLVILYLGFDPNLGLIHGRTKGGGLCYDLADVIKPVLALELAFEAHSKAQDLSEVKSVFLDRVVETDAIGFMIKCLQGLFKTEARC